MQYQRIRALTANDLELADSETPALVEVIRDYRQYLPAEAWNAFQTRVAREWAIETGQIEGLYQFDRGLTMTLIEDGITVSRIPSSASSMSPEQVTAILQDHLSTLEGLFSFVKGERPLSKGYIHELHQSLLRNQHSHAVYAPSTQTFFEKELIKGRYKEQPNNPTRPDGSILHFCPPEHVESEMDELIRLFHEQEQQAVPADLQAAWLHHAFTHIHPYADGNGRVARALATLVLIKGGLMPLVVPTAEKQRVYIPALEKADEGNYTALVDSFRDWQGRLVMELSQKLVLDAQKQPTTIDDFLATLRHDMARAGLGLPPQWARWSQTLLSITNQCRGRADAITSELSQTTRSTGWTFQFGENDSDPATATLLPATGLGYKVQRSFVLLLNTRVNVQIAIAFCTAGSKPRGLSLAVVRLTTPAGDNLLGRPFLITFSEPTDASLQRFNAWLEKLLLQALNRWRELNFDSPAS